VLTHRNLLSILALLLNAFIWGTSWWPFRQLESQGLHPLWATALIYVIAVLVIATVRPRAFGQVARTPMLWALMLASGLTNAAFNWGVVIGDVVRVVLLFYLMPLWTVVLARLLLHEPLTRGAALRVLLALTGALIVLRPAGASGFATLPMPQTLSDWLGLLGGFTFALNNVMLKRAACHSDESRALAMFIGGMVVAGSLAATLTVHQQMGWPPAPAASWVVLALALSACFLVSNMSLQYGASRLSANATSVVMLMEVVFASVSSVLLGSGTVTPPLLLGGALIVSAALFAAFEPAAEASLQGGGSGQREGS
jgi:drug/metabolite transporter (DMT)-like permease